MKAPYLLAALAALAVPSGSFAQSFDGSTLNYQYYFPTNSSAYSNADNGPFVVGAGTEVTNVADGLATLDISGNNIFIDYLSSSSWAHSSFNGWVLSDETNSLAAILGVTINPLTNMVGFDPSRISFTGDSISVNWAGLAFNANTVVSLDVAFGQSAPAVPEPSTWAMMLFGFGAVGFSMRRAKRRNEILKLA